MMADSQALEVHRVVLTGHCYRMLGSVVDADDAVQETMIRAWKGRDGFDGRASVKTWLFRIATNVCLDALGDRKRRARPMEEGPAGSVGDLPKQHERTHWLEPIPDAAAIPSDADPAEQAILRESIRLAFVAALQHLPPKQRAVLLLSEVLGWSAAEIAESIDGSVASVNSALQRARTTLADRPVRTVDPLSETQHTLLNRYVEAFQNYDVETLTALLREDATFSMPPFALWLQGPESVGQWLRGPGIGCRGSRLMPISASGLPGFAQYRKNPEGGHHAWALILLEWSGEKIIGWNAFLDTEVLFPRFGLPMALPA